MEKTPECEELLTSNGEGQPCMAQERAKDYWSDGSVAFIYPPSLCFCSNCKKEPKANDGRCNDCYREISTELHDECRCWICLKGKTKNGNLTQEQVNVIQQFRYDKKPGEIAKMIGTKAPDVARFIKNNPYLVVSEEEYQKLFFIGEKDCSCPTATKGLFPKKTDGMCPACGEGLNYSAGIRPAVNAPGLWFHTDCVKETRREGTSVWYEGEVNFTEPAVENNNKGKKYQQNQNGYSVVTGYPKRCENCKSRNAQTVFSKEALKVFIDPQHKVCMCKECEVNDPQNPKYMAPSTSRCGLCISEERWERTQNRTGTSRGNPYLALERQRDKEMEKWMDDENHVYHPSSRRALDHTYRKEYVAIPAKEYWLGCDYVIQIPYYTSKPAETRMVRMTLSANERALLFASRLTSNDRPTSDYEGLLHKYSYSETKGI